MTLRHRISPFRRGLSALLAVLYVALALGATRHAGEHDESGVEWLPQEYHHHDFQIAADGADAHPSIHELCAACQWSRLGQRHGGEGATTPDAGPVLRIVARGAARDARDGDSLLPDSRGPPSA